MPYYLTIEVVLSETDPTDALVEAAQVARLLDDETVTNVSVDYFEEARTRWISDPS